MRVFVIGGGCYGSTYVRQLRKARAKGKIPQSKWIVLDRDPRCRVRGELEPGDPVEFRVAPWAESLREIIAAGELAPGDLVVPSPFQGSLLTDWLRAEAAQANKAMRPLELREIGHGLRFEQADPAGQVRYVSFAGWTCPVHCIEPPKCPATRGPKAWDLRDTVAAVAREQGYDAVLTFPCLHWAFGVGAVPAEDFLAARRTVREGKDGKLLVASLSTCHGALSAWRLGPDGEAGRLDRL